MNLEFRKGISRRLVTFLMIEDEEIEVVEPVKDFLIHLVSGTIDLFSLAQHKEALEFIYFLEKKNLVEVRIVEIEGGNQVSVVEPTQLFRDNIQGILEKLECIN